MKDILLGVNVDHIATLRQARGTNYPDPVYAASVAEHAGADGITVHLREDRRHIQDRDIHVLKQTLHTRMNLEMAVTDEMLDIADDGTNDYYFGKDDQPIVDSDHIQRSRLRIETRKWLSSKLKPKKYGEKLQLGGDAENPLTLAIKELSGNTIEPGSD